MLSKMRTMQKEHRERWILIILGLVFGIAGMTGSALAPPPGSPYAPGETLDPSCAPGDANCTVSAPVSGSSTSTFVSFYLSSSTLGGNSGFTYTSSTQVLTVGTSSITSALRIGTTTSASADTLL